MWGKALALFLLTAGLALSGCSARKVQSPGNNPALLPMLPAASSRPDVTTPPHATSAPVEVVIHGDDYLCKSADSAPGINSLYLVAPAGEVAWAVYEIPNLEGDYRPLRLDLEFQDLSNEYYIALANYDVQRWEYQPGTYSGDASITFDGGWGKYASGTNSLYVAILEVDSPCTFEHLAITVDDTRPLPPPTGLVGTPLDGAADLAWDSYLEPRANSIRIYQGENPDLSDAALAGIIASTAMAYQVEDLTNGTIYYLAVTAYWDDEPLESGFSNIVEVTPVSSAALTLSGLWPRKSCTADNSGCTRNIGPPSFDDWVSYDLNSEQRANLNRTTPVIGTDGTVYALSSESLLFSLAGDLSVTNWYFNAADHGTPEGRYFSPPHSPIIDSEGHVYFVAAPSDPDTADPYLFCVNSDGSLGWKYELEDLSNTVDNSYPTPTITPDGMILVSHARSSKFSAINPNTRIEEWNYELSNVEIHADPSIASYGDIHLPAWQNGPGIPESILRWLSIDSSTGDLVVDWRDMGAPVNLFSGLSVGDRMFIYPQKMDLLLLDALAGEVMDQVNLNEELCSSPARNCAGSYVFQLHPPYGFTGRADLVGCLLVDAKTPRLDHAFALSLDTFGVSSQPSVDGNGVIFFPDNGGKLYRVEFDPALPIDASNPRITDQLAIGRSDTYMYNCFAIGDEAAYIITEQGKLYCVYNALD